MKLADILEFEANSFTARRPGRGIKIKRPVVSYKDNDKIVYLGTDAIQRSHSGPQAAIPGPVTTVPTIKKRLKIKRAGKLNFKQWQQIWSKEGGQKGGETLWLDNPAVTGCYSCGY